jgi:hypothetical protein
MGEHSVFGPSGAHRWLNCPGSIKAEEGIPDTGSPYAAEGTYAHAVAELCLVTSLKHVKSIIGQHVVINDVKQEQAVTSEMADHVRTYVDYVRAIGGQMEIEQKVSYEKWVPGGFGTADVIITRGRTLYVIDLKYGQGVKVYAEHSPQGMLYTLGALDERSDFQEFDKIVIIIHQPRLNHVSTWETTPDHMYKWAARVKVRAEMCLEQNAERIPGEKQCQWCKAKPTCPALLAQAETALMTRFDEMQNDTVLPTPGNLTDQALNSVLEHKKMIEKWLKSVETHVKERLEKGQNFPGWKMVNGRSTRKWTDALKAERLLKRLLGAGDAYKKTLLTPPAAEKALGKELKHRIEKLVFKADGAPALVPDDDKRPALKMTTVKDFDAFGKETTNKKQQEKKDEN